jgi:FMN phosphatase YigB (HAD superfamily)
VTKETPIVFLLDVDNTLLDNDTAQDDYLAEMERVAGPVSKARYWAIFQQLVQELGYADYLGALQRYRVDAQGHMHDPRLLSVSSYLLDYPFEQRLYPRALDVVAQLSQWGETVILTDGDVVFQPRKIMRAGLWRAVEGRVLIYIHKEQELDEVAQRYPAAHYVMVDDKVRILAAIKQVWGERVTTVFARQGHYALDARTVAAYPPADISIECIGDLLSLDRADLARAPRVRSNG